MRKVALRGLRARPVRTALTAFAVVLGVAMIAGTYVLTDTINKSFTNILAQANAGTDVVVVPRKVDDDFSSDPPPLDEELVERLRAAPGVRNVAGAVFGQVSIRDRAGKSVSSGANFVSSLQPAPFEQFRFISGRPPRALSEVALDSATFAESDFKLGDRVTIVGARGARRLRLVGSARFGEVASVGGYPVAIATLALSQELVNRERKLDSISVAGAAGVTPAQLRQNVRTALAGAPVTVRTGAEDAAQQVSDLEQDFGFFRTALLVFGGIALFVGAFVIYNTFTITVAQRTRELALLRTLGATRRQVLRSVVFEAALVGLVASLLGLLGGLALAPALRGLFQIIGADLPATR